MNTKKIQRFPRRVFVPYLVLIVGLLSTTIACYYIARTNHARDRIRFDSQVDDLTTFLKGRPRLYMELLRAGSGLYTAKPEIKLNEFQNFVARLSLASQYPGSQGLGLIARVTQAQKDSFVQSMQQQGLKGFNISASSEIGAEYYPVVSFAALESGASVPIGYDMNLDQVRREAMEHARDTALPSASGRLTLNEG